MASDGKTVKCEEAVVICENHRSIHLRWVNEILRILEIEIDGWDANDLENEFEDIKEEIRVKYESSKESKDFWVKEWEIIDKQLTLVKEKLKQWTQKISSRKK